MFEDHRRDGKKFIPPMADRNFSRIDFVEYILPEIVWIGFVLERHGTKRGIELARSLIKLAFEECTEQPAPDFSFISLHGKLAGPDQGKLRAKLEQAGHLAELQSALEPFVRCYPEGNPLFYLWEGGMAGGFSAADLKIAREVVGPRLNRWSAEGTAMQAVVMLGSVATNRITFPKDLRIPDLNAIFSGFETDEGKEASSFVRNMTSSSFMFYREHGLGREWAGYFWRRGLEIDPVKSQLEMPQPAKPDDHVLLRFRVDFARMAVAALNEITEQVVLLPVSEEVHTVINGLLARQTTLAIGVADNFEVWNWDIGPLYLRAMTDCYITLAWILGEPVGRSQEYIGHGLGQEKLWMGHYEKLLGETTDEDDKERMQMMLDISKAWVESQTFLFFVTVNVGNWTGKSVRQMAQEANCLDLYNHAYLPFSFSAHSTWNHVGKFNAVPAASPLHKNMRLPLIPHYGTVPDIALNAAKYLDKAFRIVAEKHAVKVSLPQPYDWTGERMEELVECLVKEFKQKTGRPPGVVL